MLFGDFTEGHKFTNAGVGENNIDSLLHLTDCLVETIQVGQFWEVSLKSRQVAADRRHGLVEFFLATARDEDVCHASNEDQRFSQPYHLGAARDDCNFSLQ